MLKIDLHTHSYASKDGGISEDQYISLIDNGVLDYIAITDHDTIEAALKLKKLLGDHIIIGEEITTKDGEIIGLFLKNYVEPYMSVADTIKVIKQQGGLVYVPHPFETVRKGIKKHELDKLVDQVDIIEAFNGRALVQNKGPEALTWARLHKITVASSSDAHGIKGVGRTFSIITKKPTAKNLSSLLATAHHSTKKPPIHTLFYPKINRLKKKIKR